MDKIVQILIISILRGVLLKECSNGYQVVFSKLWLSFTLINFKMRPDIGKFCLLNWRSISCKLTI